MHKSRISGFIIDCKTDDLDQAAEFWGAALGYDVTDEHEQPGSEPHYRKLDADRDNLHVELQRVEHESRMHLDLETDDLDAEVARLERLGAGRIGFVKRWWVMEAPTGQRFCVVLSKHPQFDQLAKKWSS
ncbi:MAG: VOC family protein [Gammaproteobacteria bacterium]|nr:VOC family protein [Gammaproteobacteria bacterium]